MNPGKRRKLQKLEFIQKMNEQFKKENLSSVVIEKVEVKEETIEVVEEVLEQEETKLMDNPLAQINKKRKKSS